MPVQDPSARSASLCFHTAQSGEWSPRGHPRGHPPLGAEVPVTVTAVRVPITAQTLMAFHTPAHRQDAPRTPQAPARFSAPHEDLSRYHPEGHADTRWEEDQGIRLPKDGHGPRARATGEKEGKGDFGPHGDPLSMEGRTRGGSQDRVAWSSSICGPWSSPPFPRGPWALRGGSRCIRISSRVMASRVRWMD